MGRLRSLSKADCARPKVFDAERSYFTAALQKGRRRARRLAVRRRQPEAVR